MAVRFIYSAQIPANYFLDGFPASIARSGLQPRPRFITSDTEDNLSSSKGWIEKLLIHESPQEVVAIVAWEPTAL